MPTSCLMNNFLSLIRVEQLPTGTMMLKEVQFMTNLDVKMA